MILGFVTVERAEITASQMVIANIEIFEMSYEESVSLFKH
jgi:hypothetical protein